MPHSLLVDGVRLTPKGAYTRTTLDINYIKVFGYMCYLYISPKLWPIRAISKKLLDHKRKCVFLLVRSSVWNRTSSSITHSSLLFAANIVIYNFSTRFQKICGR